MISHFNISRVLAAVDMLDLANSYSEKPLRKVGAQFVGLCPFHQERTPSFSVSASREYWHCKGCNAGGNAIDFVMRKEGIGFPEAVRLLASRAGLEFERQTPAQEAKDRYARELATEARWFWQSRGITVSDPEKAMKEYFALRQANPNLTVRQFRAEQELVKECERIETAASGMVGDLFPESFDELIDVIGRHFE